MGKFKVKEYPLSGRDGQYVMITDPWPFVSSRYANEDIQSKRDGLNAWLRRAFGATSPKFIELIFSETGFTELIVKLPLDVNLDPHLGAYHWSTFLVNCDQQERSRISCIFEYNWRRKGDPLTILQWDWKSTEKEEFAEALCPTPWPAPSRAKRPAHHTEFMLALSLDRMNAKTPELEPPPSQPAIVAPSNPSRSATYERTQDPRRRPGMPAPAASTGGPIVGPSTTAQSISPPANGHDTSAFRQYQPPSQHPSHATYSEHVYRESHSQSSRGESSSGDVAVKSEPLESINARMATKRDPYEEDDDAAALLRAPNPTPTSVSVKRDPDAAPAPEISVKAEQHDGLDARVKMETADVKPSLRTLSQPTAGSAVSSGTASALEDAFAQFQALQAAARSGAAGPSISQLDETQPGPQAASQTGPRASPPQASFRVKDEPMESRIPQPYPIAAHEPMPSVKTEPGLPSLPIRPSREYQRNSPSARREPRIKQEHIEGYGIRRDGAPPLAPSKYSNPTYMGREETSGSPHKRMKEEDRVDELAAVKKMRYSKI